MCAIHHLFQSNTCASKEQISSCSFCYKDVPHEYRCKRIIEWYVVLYLNRVLTNCNKQGSLVLQQTGISCVTTYNKHSSPVLQQAELSCVTTSRAVMRPHPHRGIISQPHNVRGGGICHYTWLYLNLHDGKD